MPDLTLAVTSGEEKRGRLYVSKKLGMMPTLRTLLESHFCLQIDSRCNQYTLLRAVAFRHVFRIAAGVNNIFAKLSKVAEPTLVSATPSPPVSSP